METTLDPYSVVSAPLPPIMTEGERDGCLQRGNAVERTGLLLLGERRIEGGRRLLRRNVLIHAKTSVLIRAR